MKNIKTIIGAIFGIFGRRHLSAVYKWLEKGPVPFLKGVIARAKPVAISFFLITSVPIVFFIERLNI